MANKLVLVFNNGAGDYTQKYISDTFADIANLPIDIFPSSKTYCLENKKQYILDLNKNWVEYQAAVTSSESQPEVIAQEYYITSGKKDGIITGEKSTLEGFGNETKSVYGYYIACIELLDDGANFYLTKEQPRYPGPVITYSAETAREYRNNKISTPYSRNEKCVVSYKTQGTCYIEEIADNCIFAQPFNLDLSDPPHDAIYGPDQFCFYVEAKSTRALCPNGVCLTNAQHAEGYKTKALGSAAHAEGIGTQALDGCAHAEGNNTIAQYGGAHAEGSLTRAIFPNAHAEGTLTTAKGARSHAEGWQTKAYGWQSHAEGQSTVTGSENDESYGGAAHAEGINTVAKGAHSHAEGKETWAGGEDSHAEGANTIATGKKAHAEGRQTTASGPQSHAEGDQSTASGPQSHAEGWQTIASADASHAEGCRSEASGSQSHAEGLDTAATWQASHAEGKNTVANNLASHAEGYKTEALGQFSHAEGNTTYVNSTNSHVEGYGTRSEHGSQHVSGKYNAPMSAAEIVGGGSDNQHRINIRVLDWNGNETIAGKMTVGTDPENDNDVATKKYVDNHTHDTATTTTDGMMSSADKTSLEVLKDLLGDDSDSVVNKIDEILAIFENYPEGDKIVQTLADKSDTNHIHYQYVVKRASSAGAIHPSGELYGVSSAGNSLMFPVYTLATPSSAIVQTNGAGKIPNEVLPTNIPTKDAEGYLPVKTPTSEAEISTHLGVAASYYYVKQVDAALRQLIHNRDNNIILSYPAGTSANNFAIKSIVPVMMHPSYMQSFADLPSGPSSLFTGIVLTVGDPEAGFKIQLAIARAGHIYTRMCSPNAYAQMTWSNWCSTEKEYATTETAGVVKVGEGIELADNAISVIHASQEYSIEWADAITLKTNKIGTITINGATTISKEDAIAGYSCTWGINIIEEDTAYPITFADEINWDAGIAPAFSANSITQVWLYYKGPMLCGTWS